MSKEFVQPQNLAIGCNTIEEMVKHSPRRILKIYYVKLNQETQARKIKLLEDLKKLRVPMIACTKLELDRLSDSSSHQGVVAILKKRELFDLEHFIKTNKNKLVVMLDSINDPHNLGAILRASECFDVGAVIWSKNRGASLSPVVSKVSSSASEFVSIAIVSNLAMAIDKFKAKGYTIIGAQVSEKSHNLFHYKFPEKSVLIMGSEGEGIRSLLQKKLDDSVFIPMHGKIDSLNVSQAAALCLGIWRSQQV